jgi:hypothetical protein
MSTLLLPHLLGLNSKINSISEFKYLGVPPVPVAIGRLCVTIFFVAKKATKKDFHFNP